MRITTTTIECSAEDLRQSNTLADGFMNFIRGIFANMNTPAAPDDAGKWIAAQDKLMRQILQLGAELGITPKARRERGLTR